MVQLVATTPFIPHPLHSSQRLSLGTRFWNRVSVMCDINWKENTLGALTVYYLFYAFVAGSWWVTGMALFTAGFCSAMRKDIRNFTNLRGATKDYLRQNREHFHLNMEYRQENAVHRQTNEEQRALNESYCKANQEHRELNEFYRQTNEEQQRITQELEKNNRWLKDSCQTLENKLRTLGQQLELLSEETKKIRAENDRYSTLNAQHEACLKTFETQSNQLKIDIDKLLSRGEKINEHALRGILTSLTTLDEQRKLLDAINDSIEKKDDETLKTLRTLSTEMKDMGLDHLRTLAQAKEELQATYQKIAVATSKLEQLEESIARLENLLPELEAATLKNLQTADRANQANATVVSLLFSTLFGNAPSHPSKMPVEPNTVLV